VKRKHGVMYIRAFMAVYAHIWGCMCLGDICMLCDVVIKSYMLFDECVM